MTTQLSPYRTEFAVQRLGSTSNYPDPNGPVGPPGEEPLEEGGSANTPQQVEAPVYAAGQLGTYYRGSTGTVAYKIQYAITDHLGNVRVVIRGEKNASGEADVLGYTDYYPFGWEMPGRQMSGDNRYAYQGIEKDPETGWTSFQLRMYDSRIGRWAAPDPMGQYYSPYLAMGNDPVNMVDPNGGFAVEPWMTTLAGAAIGFGAGYAVGKLSGSDDPWKWGLAGAGIGAAGGLYVGAAFDINVNLNVKYGGKKITGRYIGLGGNGVDLTAIGDFFVDIGLKVYSLTLPTYHIYEDPFHINPRTGNYDGTYFIYQNAKRALMSHPNWFILTYNGGGDAKRRKRNHQFDRLNRYGFTWIDPRAFIFGAGSMEEFPPAMAEEGWNDAFLTPVPLMEQWIQGGQLGIIARKVRWRGGKFRVKLHPINREQRRKVPYLVPSPSPGPIIQIIPLAPDVILPSRAISPTWLPPLIRFPLDYYIKPSGPRLDGPSS